MRSRTVEPRIADDEHAPTEDSATLDPEAPAAPEDAETPEAAETPAAAEEPNALELPPTGKPRKRFLTVLLCVLLVVVSAAAVFFALAWQGAQHRERARTEVASAATQFLQALTNFGGPTIDRDVANIRSYAIGDFASQVAQFFDASTVAALREANAVSVGHVQSVFVESLSGGTAEVFGVVDETLSNAKTSAHAETLRIDVEMVDTSSGWKVDRVTLLQSPGASGFPSSSG